MSLAKPHRAKHEVIMMKGSNRLTPSRDSSGACFCELMMIWYKDDISEPKFYDIKFNAIALQNYNKSLTFHDRRSLKAPAIS